MKQAFVFQAHPIVGYCSPQRPAATPQSRPSSGYSRMCAVSEGPAQREAGRRAGGLAGGLSHPLI